MNALPLESAVRTAADNPGLAPTAAAYTPIFANKSVRSARMSASLFCFRPTATSCVFAPSAASSARAVRALRLVGIGFAAMGKSCQEVRTQRLENTAVAQRHCKTALELQTASSQFCTEGFRGRLHPATFGRQRPPCSLHHPNSAPASTRAACIPPKSRPAIRWQSARTRNRRNSPRRQSAIAHFPPKPARCNLHRTSRLDPPSEPRSVVATGDGIEPPVNSTNTGERSPSSVALGVTVTSSWVVQCQV